MGMRFAKLAMTVGAVASLGLASPAAAAAPVCVGTQQTAGVCVWATPSTLYEDCIYLGSTTCTPVSVPGVDPGCSGWVGGQWILECR